MRLRAMNPAGRIYRTHCSQIELDKVLGIEAFELEKKLELDPGFLEEEAHEHDDAVTSLVFREDRSLDLKKLEDFLGVWLSEHGVDTFRYKGVLHIKDVEERVLFQGIHMLFTSDSDRSWKEGEERRSEFVIIGRNLDEAWFREQFAGCVAV
ncbi:CobW family GTP-binding protein [Paenibacillus sp. S-38]|uniref:CobW family GTP-binding protein n=1 Tax=Paenibacillus sp. S-38 TaxID=3416710 RepID=UPI003CF0C175